MTLNHINNLKKLAQLEYEEALAESKAFMRGYPVHQVTESVQDDFRIFCDCGNELFHQDDEGSTLSNCNYCYPP